MNIRLPEDYTKDNIELLEAAYEKGFNISIILPDIYYAEQLRDHGVPFFLARPATTWDEFRGMLNLGVSDVYIANELGFSLETIAPIAERSVVQIRCYANIAQSSWKFGDGFKDFYIRPEDVDYYSNFIDVIEFYDAVDQQNVLYEVYFKDKEWNGKLREIIKGFKSNIDNYYLLGDEFAKRRVKCEKKCLKGGKCRLCDELSDLAISLEKSPDF